MTATDHDVERIHARLDDLFGVLTTVQTDVAVTKANCGPCKESIDKLVHTVYGNEKKGLTSRVDSLESTAQTGKRIFWRIFEPLLAAIGGGGIVALMK